VTGREYFLTDMLSSTIALTDPNGAIRQQYSYDPYGNVTSSDTTTGFTNPYQYTGREADSPGLYYYRARYYSPMMGGFISEDPIGFRGGQLSFYAYVNGSPISYADPLGLWSFTFGGYLGPGIEITFGNDGGNHFMTARIGIGVGMGASYDPNGGLPGDAPENRRKSGEILSASAQVGFNAGPLNAGAEIGAARNYRDGESSIYGGPSYGATSEIWGLGASASIGGQLTVYNGAH